MLLSIPDHQEGIRLQVEDPVYNGGAEERRLRRMDQYAARRSDRRQRLLGSRLGGEMMP
jgi:hypothetical protein